MWGEGSVARCDASYLYAHVSIFHASPVGHLLAPLPVLRLPRRLRRAQPHARLLCLRCTPSTRLPPASPPPAPSHHRRHRRCHTRLTPHAPHTPRACSSLRYSASCYGASSHVGDHLYHGASSHVRDLPLPAHHPMVHDAPAPRCAASPPRSHAAAWLHPGPHSLCTTGGREGRGEWAVST